MVISREGRDKPLSLQEQSTTGAYRSWGGYPTVYHRAVLSPSWRTDMPDLSQQDAAVLPFGNGRSYGDSCLNAGGILVDTTNLNQLMAFDRENGVLRCEAGVTMLDILDLIVPHGWFVPVSPGTKFVTVGGAIANDVHGKNHHAAGTFGCHVTQFELLRSTGERLLCSPIENDDLFRATIGGLGLTGIITWAEFRLRSIPSPLVQTESIQFHSIEEFFALSAESEHHEYSVSWVDCTATGHNFGRGLFGRGDFYDPPLGYDDPRTKLKLRVPPVELPFSLVGNVTARIFNELYYRKQIRKHTSAVSHYDPFFYPLDAIHDWHRVYGKDGFLQHQCVVPYEDSIEPIREILRRIVASGQASPLVVFKTFGDMESPGLLSFPRPGVTLALDFPYRGKATLDLLDSLDEIVFAHGGALYPAKDARMSPAHFRQSYPQWETFAQCVDPKFSSSFWRRVTETER